jgi:hypothetical protein
MMVRRMSCRRSVFIEIPKARRAPCVSSAITSSVHFPREINPESQSEMSNFKIRPDT